jgi:3-hydroxyacyl-CoA dehydrogenase/nucleoside-diphosphate-sugar epimerase
MIQTIGVCGAGTMGSGIAQVAAMAGYRTILYDMDAGMLQKGRTGIEKSLAALTEKNRISAEEQTAILGRIAFVNDPGQCVADLIIEAIVESPDIKKALFVRLAAVNGPGTILASNTSSLSLTDLAGSIPGPERFAGMHFFNPAPLMKLVEIVRTGYTGEQTIGTLMETAKKMGKTPVLCKDAPGFIVNHVARPYYLEALRLLEAGIGDIETIDTLMEGAGFRMGPFRLMDLIGNDINFAVSGSVYEALDRPERLKPSPAQEEKVSRGELGRKTGKGWYEYDDPLAAMAATPTTATMPAPSVARQAGQNVLVTGASGFLGAYIIQELVKTGHSVRAIHRNGSIPFFLPDAVKEKVEWLPCDIRDIVGLEDAMAGVDAVIHAAARVSFSGKKDRQELYSVNIDGTAHIVNIALIRQVRRFIHISSVAALGRTGDGSHVTEEKTWEDSKYNTNYAISKFHGEMEVWRGIGEGLPAVIVNPSTLLGFGDWNSSSCRLFHNAYREFPWYTEGINGFVDVADAARAVVRLMEGDICGQRYILNGDNWSFRHLFETMAAEFGKKPPSHAVTPVLAGVAWRLEGIKSLFTGKPPLLTRESARVASSSTYFDNRKILRQLPGFQFTPLEETIREACKKYLNLPV